jgi:hypothetical protein
MNCSTCGKKLRLKYEKHIFAMGLESENIQNIKEDLDTKRITADFEVYSCPSLGDSHEGFCFFKGKTHLFVWNNKQLKWVKVPKVKREEVLFT